MQQQQEECNNNNSNNNAAADATTLQQHHQQPHLQPKPPRAEKTSESREQIVIRACGGRYRGFYFCSVYGLVAGCHGNISWRRRLSKNIRPEKHVLVELLLTQDSVSQTSEQSINHLDTWPPPPPPAALQEVREEAQTHVRGVGRRWWQNPPPTVKQELEGKPKKEANPCSSSTSSSSSSSLSWQKLFIIPAVEVLQRKGFCPGALIKKQNTAKKPLPASTGFLFSLMTTEDTCTLRIVVRCWSLDTDRHVGLSEIYSCVSSA